jgi:catechol 2,3-dioxygenase-like lactoylglutathione lyase family enzyme
MAVQFDHVNVTVADIERSAEFLRVAFPHFKRRGGGEGEFGGMKTAWMHLGTDEMYVSLNQTSVVKTSERDGSKESGINHVGFIVVDVDAVQAKYEPAGFKVSPMNEQPARKRLYVTDHDNIMWEFVQYLSDDPAVQNDYTI